MEKNNWNLNRLKMLKKALILAITLAFSMLSAEETVLLGANDETGEAWQHVANRNHDVLVKFRNPFFGVKPLYIQSFEVFLEDTKPFQWAVVDTMDGMKDMESNPVKPYYNSLGNLLFDSLALSYPGLYGTAAPTINNGFNSFTLSENQKSTPITKPYFYFLFCASANNSSQGQIRLRLDTDLSMGNNTFIYYHHGYNAANQWFYQFQPVSAEGDADGNVLMKIFSTDQVNIPESKETDCSNRLIIENYPNPFNNSTTIKISNFPNQSLSLNLYNSSGQMIKSITTTGNKQGTAFFSIDGKNLNSGLYYLKSEETTHKLIFLK